MPSGKLMRVGFQTRGWKEYCCPMIFSMSPAEMPLSLQWPKPYSLWGANQPAPLSRSIQEGWCFNMRLSDVIECNGDTWQWSVASCFSSNARIL